MNTASQGRDLRKAVPRSSHGGWEPSTRRADPVQLVEEQNLSRLEWLVPMRRARMAESPFSFFRGAARIMAHDLAETPTTGLTTQICGDAHLSNFGAFASPERTLLFDLNDFDETLSGPWEWDVKRLSASLVIAADHLGFEEGEGRALVEAAMAAYRYVMRSMSELGWLEAWYRRFSLDELADRADEGLMSKGRQKKLDRFIKQAKKRDHLRAARKLVVEESGRYRFRSDPPLLVRLEDLDEEASKDELEASVRQTLEGYRSSLSDQTRLLLDRYRLSDVALKVVGVGSVGTRCSVVLLVGRSTDDVLILQVKEAGRSVLEEHLPASPYSTSGQRVVEGQRLMQAASDIFLGWSESAHSGHHYYWRQLKDWKASFDLEGASTKAMERYARSCGATLARAHAVAGDPAAISGYLGKSNMTDRAMAEFGMRYARQNLDDYEKFAELIEDGSLEAGESR